MSISDEKLIAFANAPAAVKGRPSICTLHRWRLRGCRGVLLETILLGGRRFTSEEALERFFTAVTAAADNKAPTPTATEKRQSADAARRILEAARI